MQGAFLQSPLPDSKLVHTNGSRRHDKSLVDARSFSDIMADILNLNLLWDTVQEDSGDSGGMGIDART